MAAALDAQLKKFVDAMNRGDGPTLNGLFTQDCKLLAPKSDVINGPSDSADHLIKVKETLGISRLETMPDVLREINVSGDNLAWVAAAYKPYDKSGNPMDITFKDIVVWKLVGGQWLFYRGIYNA